MPDRIAVEPDPHVGQEVDFAGHIFTLRIKTRSVMEARRAYGPALLASETDDEATAAIGALLDAILVPEPGKRKKPSAILAEKWQAEEWSDDQVANFVAALIDAQDAEPESDPT